jgi:hypothetical protein
MITNILISILVFCAALLVFYLTHNTLALDAMWMDFSKELTMAFLIASVLTITVELLNHISVKRLREKLNADIFNAVLTRKFPEEIVSEFYKGILNFESYRLENKLRFTLSPLQGRLFVDAFGSYEVKNMTASAIEYIFLVSIDVDKKNPMATKIKELRIDDEEVNKRDMKNLLKETKTHHVFKKTVEIAANSRKRFSYKYTTAADLNWFETICCTGPSLGLKVNVEVRNMALEVSAEGLHRCDPKIVKAEHDGVKTFAWEMPAAVLPYQGLQVKWTPLIAASANLPAPASAAIPKVASRKDG